MKHLLTTAALLFGIVSVTFFSCRKDELKNHANIDKQDASVLEKLKVETQNSKQLNATLKVYHDSLANCIDSVEIEILNNDITEYDSLYHESASLCITYQNELNEIHQCGMLADCEMGMEEPGQGVMMMNKQNKDKHQCDLMEDLQLNCSETSNIEQDHTLHCSH